MYISKIQYDLNKLGFGHNLQRHKQGKVFKSSMCGNIGMERLGALPTLKYIKTMHF